MEKTNQITTKFSIGTANGGLSIGLNQCKNDTFKITIEHSFDNEIQFLLIGNDTLHNFSDLLRQISKYIDQKVDSTQI